MTLSQATLYPGYVLSIQGTPIGCCREENHNYIVVMYTTGTTPREIFTAAPFSPLPETATVLGVIFLNGVPWTVAFE